MTAAPVGDSNERALRVLLERHPEAVVAAFGSDGFLVPAPDSLGLRTHQLIPLPPDRSTMVALVVSADAMTVVTTWERAIVNGLAVGTVRTKDRPDRFLTLTFMDLRAQHGVRLAILTQPDETQRRHGADALAGSLAVPLRPRTATMWKTWRAVISNIDDRASRMLGWSPDQMIGVRSLDFYHLDDHERAVASWMEMLSTKQSQRVRLRHRCLDGTWRWLEIEHLMEDADDLENTQVIARISDITDEMAAHEALGHREKLFRRLAESIPLGLLQVDRDRTVVYANSRLAGLLRVTSSGSLDELWANVVEADRPALDQAMAQALAGGSDHELEVEVSGPTGELYRCQVSLISLSDDEGAPGALACVWDVTDGARMREELRKKATFDALTGCYNRAATLALLNAALTDDVASGVAVVFVDLDQFKSINDRFGHAAGDDLLLQVTGLINRAVRDGDLVGRIGGDEFLVVCTGIAGSAAAVAVADRIQQTLLEPVELSANPVHITASIGVAYVDTRISPDALVARADQAMYTAKRRGDGRPELWQD